MENRINFFNLVAEIHPQHYGSIENIKRIILSAKIAGATSIKVQLYDTLKIHKNTSKKYLEITFNELKILKDFCEFLGIELFASVFNEDRIEWCEKLNFDTYKIASRSVSDEHLCKKIISTKKKVIISTGMHDWKNEGFPYEEQNVEYLYCVSKYPTFLEEIEMPDFTDSKFTGYSDHTIGINACLFAASKGAKIIEKHFSLNQSLQNINEKAHICSMGNQELKILRDFCESLYFLNR